MLDTSKTWVVECYVPGVDDAAVRDAAERTAAQIRRLGPDHAGIEYLGALLMAVDEVVLHAFRAVDQEVVRGVSTAAGLRFERIVESVEVAPAQFIRPAGPSRRET
jgi:hypothetical protein